MKREGDMEREVERHGEGGRNGERHGEGGREGEAKKRTKRLRKRGRDLRKCQEAKKERYRKKRGPEREKKTRRA